MGEWILGILRRSWKKAKRFFQRVGIFISYWKVLKDDWDWDYGCLLELERFKLERMRKWWEDHDMGNTVSGPRIYRQLSLAVDLLDILLDKKPYYHLDRDRFSILPIKDLIGNDEKWVISVYINLQNWRNYLSPRLENFVKRNPNLAKIELREAKAWALYCKLRERYLKDWWD